MRVPDQSQLPQNLELSFAVGDRISNRYVIEERLGQGGMGVVYRAHDTLVDEGVALKFMKPQLLTTQKGQLNFIQEAQIARRLRHENIVAVHDISWTSEGILFLSMEYLPGQSVRTLLRRYRREPRFVGVRLAVKIVSDMLTALDYAHRTVVHRDLKPENLILMPGEQVKVLDFGLAKAIDDETFAPPSPGRDTSRDTGRVAGTFAYAAPEQRKHWPVDLRADLYSVGLIFHELLTLRTPIDPAVTISQVRNDVSPSLQEVLQQALCEDRELRWPSAAAFRRNLQEAFDQSYRRVTVAVPDRSERLPVSTEDMVFLEGGSFLIGCSEVKEEAPEWEACVAPFYMDKYPVTVKQYEAFLKATGRPEPKHWHDPKFSGPNQPVVGVSWDDAAAYAAWAGKQLATEIQWEFAARGQTNRLYPWGNQDPDRTRCNFGDNLSMPSIVTMHKEGMTPEGIRDMAGNVYEWTQDAYLPYEKARANGKKAPTPLRTVRGGCWNSRTIDLRCAHRKGLFPETRLPTVGFRCVLSMESNGE